MRVLLRALMLAALAWPVAAWAMPPVIAVVALAVINYGAVMVAGVAMFAGVAVSTWTALIMVSSMVYGAIEARNARRAARDAYNNSLTDRNVTLMSTDAPWQVVYGTATVGGRIAAVLTSGDRDEFKHVVIVWADHECDAITDVQIAGLSIGPLDVDGNVTEGKWLKWETVQVQGTYTFDAGGSITLADVPAELLAVTYVEGTGDAQYDVALNLLTATVVGAVVTCHPDDLAIWAGKTVTATYVMSYGRPLVRIRHHLGAPGQAADASLLAECPGQWSATDVGNAKCYSVLRLDLNEPEFQGGPPQTTVTMRGRKVYDPRTSTTAWSANNALCIADWLQAPWGKRALSTMVNTADTMAAANACDTAVPEMGGVPLYTCNGAFTTDTDPDQVLDQLAQSMAGFVTWTGEWRIYAGVYSAPVMALTDADVAGSIEILDTPSRLQVFNGVRGKFYDTGRYNALTDYPSYWNNAFRAEDGEALWTDVPMPFTDSSMRCHNIARILVERSRSMQLVVPCKLRALRLRAGQRVTLANTMLGFAGDELSTFRVIKKEWQLGKFPALTLERDHPTFWDLADAPGDLDDPDVNLPDPWVVAAPTGITATTGTGVSLVGDDGNDIVCVKLGWNPSTDSLVTSTGAMEVRAWVSYVPEQMRFPDAPGSSSGTLLSGLQNQRMYTFSLRWRNGIGATSDWRHISIMALADQTPPDDVTGLTWSIKPGQVVIRCNPSTSRRYADTELRYSAVLTSTWDDATFLVRGASTEYHHPRPPNGTYLVLAKHRTKGGRYSVNAAAITVTVDDSIDGAEGGYLVLTADGTHFAFSDGTTHSSTSPDIHFVARGVGLLGTATWEARAFDAFAGGTDIGPVTLTINGNGATLSAAQFCAPGTLGSVRRVQVGAALAGQTDTRTVYRLDPTVTTPVLWLSDERVVLPADAAGENPDLSLALTFAAVYQGTGTGIADLTNVHTWSIVPDTGITATINDGPGPVVNPSNVRVQGTGMTIRSGVVKVRATPAVGPVLEADWYLDISPADGSGWHAYWQPPSLTLPVRPDGSVATFDGATSAFAIVNAMNQLDDTANWAKSITARNVTAELVGARAAIVSWLPLGQVTVGPVIPATPHASWTRADWPIYTPRGNWLQVGYNNSAPWATVRRATAYDAAPWPDIVVPSGWWAIGDASRDTIILVEITGSSNRYLRSVDDGLTWVEETLPSGAQRYDCKHTGAEWLISSQGSTAGYRSVTGVAGTWTPITLPGNGCVFGAGAGVVVCTTSSGLQYYSINGGVTWQPMADGYSGAAAFRGRLYTVLSGDPTKMLVWDGGRWVKQALPASASGYNGLLVIRDVLYLLAGGNIMYTSDGLTWRAGGSGASTLGAWVRSGSRALMVDFIPTTNTAPAASNYAVWTPLLSTSDTEASVTMHATKPGEEDLYRTLMVYKGQAPRVTYVASANPAILPLPATSTGQVTDYSNATVTGQVTEDGEDVTSLYSISWSTTYLTPASGTGAVVNITGMLDAQPEGYIDWQAVRPGYPVVTGRTLVRKVLGNDPGGPRVGKQFAAIGANATSVSLRIAPDGFWYLKVGSGAWAVQDRWVLGVDPTSFWLFFEPPTEGPFTTGTSGTWLQVNANRDVVLTDSSPGTHTRTFRLLFSPNSTGSNASLCFGQLMLIVP